MFHSLGLKAQTKRAYITKAPEMTNEFIPDWEENRTLFGVLGAGIRIVTMEDRLQFDSDKKVINVFNKDDGFLILLPPDSERLTISGDDFTRSNFSLKRLGIKLKSGTVWKITIESESYLNSKTEIAKQGLVSVEFSSNIEDTHFKLFRGSAIISEWKSDYESLQLEPGNYKVVVESKKKKTQIKEFMIRSDDFMELDFTMEDFKLDSTSGLGNLVIKTNESLSELTIRREGNLIMSKKGNPTEIDLPVGLYTVTAQFPNSLAYQSKFYINANEIKKIEVPNILAYNKESEINDGVIKWISPPYISSRSVNEKLNIRACIKDKDFEDQAVLIKINGISQKVPVRKISGIQDCGFYIDQRITLTEGENSIVISYLNEKVESETSIVLVK